eukprot:6177278-Pleurochrysis_carterae.AAC.2
MSATRLWLGAVEIWDEIEARSLDGQLVDGRLAFSFARQIGGDVTRRDFQVSFACFAHQPTRNKATEYTLESHLPVTGAVFYSMFALNAMDTSYSLDLFRLRIRYAVDQKLYGAMLRGELPYASLQLAPRNLDIIPSIENTTTGPDATRAALRAQVLDHESKLKQDSKEALVRDYSNRIVFFLAIPSSMRPRAGLKLRKLQDTHTLPRELLFGEGVLLFDGLLRRLQRAAVRWRTRRDSPPLDIGAPAPAPALLP